YEKVGLAQGASGAYPSATWESDRRVIEQLRVALLNQRLLDGRLMHFVVVLVALFGLDAETLEQLHILVGLRVGGGQQFLAVEDRVGAGKEGQGLHLLVHLLAAG